MSSSSRSTAIPDDTVLTFGLNEEQNAAVRAALPAKGYVLNDTDVVTDLIAVPASALIINAAALDAHGSDTLFQYYTELDNSISETVFWIGWPKPPFALRHRIKCFEIFDELAVDLKYRLLSAHRKSKKAMDFSKKMADCISILSLIRSHPGIKTQAIAEQLELPVRTVQRYIATLQAAGEWIEYDTAKKGWCLQNRISIFFGDHLK